MAYDSLSGESDVENNVNSKRWAVKQAELTKRQTRIHNDQVQTYEQYLAARSGDAEGGGKIPVWRVADLTQFIADDVQKAMNALKDGADIVKAYSGLFVEVASVLSKVAKADASVIEELVNALRNEIKDILDSLFAVGGVYSLYIPPDARFGGGIDYFKKEFLNSLEDSLDLRRPQISDTTTVNGLFMLAGAPDFSSIKPSLDGFSKFIFSKDRESSYTGDLSTPIPPPEDFRLTTTFSPRIKSPTKTDDLYKFATDNESDDTSILRQIEGWTSLVEKSSTLLVDAQWSIPDDVEFGVSSLDDTVANYGFYKIVAHTEKRTGIYDTEFTREETIITDWVLVKSPNADEINSITENHEAVLTALNEQRDIPSGEFGLSDHAAVFRGDVIPGFHYYHDDDIEPPDKSSITATINGIPIPEGKLSKSFRRNNYYYKVLFAGVRRKFRVKYVEVVGGGGDFKVYGSLSEFQDTTPNVPYSSTPMYTSNIDDIRDITSEDIFSGLGFESARAGAARLRSQVQPIYSVRNDLTNPNSKKKSAWITSAFSATRLATNTSVVSPNNAAEPNWYSMQMREVIPPLKKLSDEAARFVDGIADTLIESVNGIADMVEALEAEIRAYDAWITKIMNMIKGLLFPPMAGIHVLQISSNRGIDGIKASFNKSFSGSPRSSTGEKDYPDSYIKYGSRTPVGGKLMDIGGNTYKGMLPERTSSIQNSDGSYTALATTPTEAGEFGSLHFTEMNKLLFGGSDDRRRRHNEPSDEDMRKLGIPMYDSQHFVGGFVFLFEKVSAFNAFIRLLQLDDFFNAELDKAKKKIIGLSALSRIHFPSLNNIHTLITSRDKKLQQRLARAGDTRYSDDDAVNEEADIAVLNRRGVCAVDENGNCIITVDGVEPFIMIGAKAVLTYTVNGIVMTVFISSKNGESEITLSAKDLADKINASYLLAIEAYCKSSGLSAEECEALKNSLSGLVSASSDGGLSFRTPPRTFGDRSGTFTVGSASFPLANMNPGDSYEGVDTDGELESLEEAFPHATGDLIVETVGFGTPTPEMYRSSRAVYDFAKFVSDPLVQDFGPSRHKLQLKIDSLPVQLIDVTADGGTRPNDVSPIIIIEKEGGGVLDFPLYIDGTNNKFNIELSGSFTRVENLEGLRLENFTKISSTAIGNFDFISAGVRPGDSLGFVIAGDTSEFNTIVTRIESGVIYIENSFTAFGDITITYIEAGGLPSIVKVETNGGGTLSREVSIPVNADVSAVNTYEDAESLIQDIVRGLDDSGLNGVFELEDASGRIKMTTGSWGIGDTTNIKFLIPDYNGSPAVINTVDISPFFPLTVDSAKTHIRIELFGQDNVSVGFKTLTIPENTYTTSASFIAVIQNSLDSEGLTDVKVFMSPNNTFSFRINNLSPLLVPEPKHYSYSEKVGINLAGLVEMDRSVEYDNFIDGVSTPPNILTSSITFPLSISSGYGSRFFITITPSVPGRVSTTSVEVNIPTGVYINVGELRSAVEDGLVSSDLISGLSGFLRVDTVGLDRLRFYLAPESEYIGSSSSLSLFNGRSISGVPLTGVSVITSDMRDYNYEKVFSWLTTNSSTIPTPGFPDPAPLAFLASDYLATGGPTVYDGTWDIVSGINDAFYIELVTPVIGALLGEQKITVAAGNYSSMAALVIGIQTNVDLVYGVGIITVSDTGAGDGLGFSLVGSVYFGGFTELKISSFGTENFNSMGSQTAGAILTSGVGSGDITFLELIGGVDVFAVGSDNLMAYLGMGSEYSAAGGNDYNFIRIIDGYQVSSLGTFKETYSIDEIVFNINTHLRNVVEAYGSSASNYLGEGRVRLGGKTRGVGGLIDITAVSVEGDLPSLESSEVAELVFGVAGRDSDIVVRGVGRDIEVKTVVVDIENAELVSVVEVLGYTVMVENDALIVDLVREDFFEMITEIESL